MLLEDKVVLITGVGSGLGREVALQCAADGARTVLGARTVSQLEAVAGEVDPSGDRVAWARTDITAPEDCAAIVRTARERFGRVDALVQVAAFEFAMGGLWDSDFDAWRKCYDTNVIGSVQLVREVATAMKEQGGGSVVFIGSQSSVLPSIPQAGYGASKGALNTVMYYLTHELGPFGIRVNTVMPSWMWGPPVQAFVKMTARNEGRSEEQVLADITSKIPLRAIAADEDVAQAVSFFCSERAKMITGQSLLVNACEFMP